MKTIVAFIIIFGILVFVHEFGHYYVAKKCGILVREFSIGMGPKILAFHKNSTTYTLRLLPLGGYVRMAGLDEDEGIKPGTTALIKLDSVNKISEIDLSNKVNELDGIPIQIDKSDLVNNLYIDGYINGDDSDLKHYNVEHNANIIEPDGTSVQIAPIDVQYQSVSAWKRIMVNFAGPFNNFILSIVAFLIFTFVNGGVTQVNSTKIGQVEPDFPAQKAGICSGDSIIKINNKKVSNFNDIANIINSNPGKNINLLIKTKNNKLKNINLKIKSVENHGKKIGLIGIVPSKKNNFITDILYAWNQMCSITISIFSVLIGFLKGGFSLNKLAGPVGIYSMTSEAVKFGIPTLIDFTGMLSLNLGIMNLIPIPALDGGKVLLNFIEAIRHKNISVEKERILTIAGFVFLLILMIIVTGNDIMRYFK